MSTVSPPEPFPIEPTRSPRAPAIAPERLPAVRMGGAAMVAGASALVIGALIELAEGVLAAGAPGLFRLVGPLEAPLLACGQVLLVGGAITARLARRRAARRVARAADEA